jgi:AraC-like DNA-binding protein
VHGTRHPRIVDGDLYRRLCDAHDLIHDAYDEPLDLRTLARAAGVSRFHFQRSFARAFGETPHQQLTRVRIHRAQEQLRAGRAVTDVCLDVGFASLGSFSGLFRREVGVSPIAYQRALRHLAQVPMAYALFSIPFCLAMFLSGDGNFATIEKRPPFRP